MARLRRTAGHAAASEDGSERLRAAWLYYNHGLTQQEVAARLGISRGTAIKLLEEAKQRGEVQFWISEGEPGCVELALKLEDVLDLDEAIVVPRADNAERIANAVGLALGKFLSEVVTDGMTIGVGWGRTLMASLASLRPARPEGVKVVSLVGGVVEARGGNPLEYTWRMASQFGSDCYLFIAPAFVDSAATKKSLIEKCGLAELYRLSASLDLAVVGVGDIGSRSTGLAAKMLSLSEIDELIEMGCVGDVLCNFIDAEGRSIAHPVNRRAMSVRLEDLAKAGHLVIAAGGARRARAIRAAIARVGCHTLITDEGAARALIAREKVSAI
jgi:DNA-binding transcriptional regulator LsrR (DeoR family)